MIVHTLKNAFGAKFSFNFNLKVFGCHYLLIDLHGIIAFVRKDCGQKVTFNILSKLKESKRVLKGLKAITKIIKAP
jgi:hypothetical protein